MATQKQKILNYLQAHGEITVKEAIWELGITQAATRIKELIEEDGEPITRNDWREVTRNDGTKTQVRVYRLKEQPEQSEMFANPKARAKYQGPYSGVN